MEYLLVMSLSGGTMTGIYLILRRLFKDKICARFYDLLARAAILYYLVPLPYLKKCYVAVMRFFYPESPMEISRVPLSWRNHIVHAEGTLHANIFAIVQMTAAVVWVAGICILMVKQVAEYVMLVRLAAGYADRAMTPEQRTFIGRLKKQYGVRRRVFLYEAPEKEYTMTFGFLRPVIVCSRETADREAELLVRHELVHIRRMDTFWKMLMQLAAMIFWWNPLTWILRRDFEQVCECSCDEIVMQEKTKEEVKEYLRLMIEEAQEKKPKNVSPRWKAGFGDDTQKMKERMENLMRKKNWNRVAAVALVATLAFANSMTVFAYRDPIERETTEEVPTEEVELVVESDTFMFVPEKTDEGTTQEFKELEMPELIQGMMYDRQFVDEEGNIYPIMEDDGIEPHCNHTFVNGTGYDHIPQSGGGCIMLEYEAQRCSKCGYIIQGKTIQKVTYAVCPHK